MIKLISCYIEIAWANVLIFLKIKKSTTPIPDNTPYCYIMDDEKNLNEPHKNGGYWIKTCKYYRFVNDDIKACTYVGYIGDDLLLNDQCKICGEKQNYESSSLM